MSRTTATHPVGLTKDLVVKAAIKLADVAGLEAMSMRKLGRELGVEAMALYYHFASKNLLIEAMIDYIHGEFVSPQDNANWREYMQKRAESAFEVLLLHPWAAPIMEAGVNPGPSTLRDSDNCIKSFRKAEFSVPDTVHAVTVLNIYIYGAAMLYARLSFTTSDGAAELSESVMSQFPIDDYPHLGEIITEHMMKSSYDARQEYYFGLNLILDGIARLDPRQ
jgi:hypothetical protein